MVTSSLRALGRHVEEQPAVIDLEDIGAERAEPRRDLPEHAGPVGNGEAERDDAVLALEFAHHDRGEDARIDIAAAQDQADLACRESAPASPASRQGPQRPRPPPSSSAASGRR